MRSSARGSWLALLCGLVLAGEAGAEEKRALLLIQSSGGPAAVGVLRGLESSLERAADDVALYIELFDASRFPGDEHSAAMAQFLEKKYAGTSFDVLVAGGPKVLGFVIEQGPRLFRNVPVVFVGIRSSSAVLQALPSNVTGIASRFDVAGTLELALALQPEARRVVLVSGVASLDRGWREIADTQTRAYADRLQIVHWSGWPLERVLTEAARLPHETVLIFLTMLEDGTGRRFARMNELAGEIAAASSAPLYGVYETYLGRGVIGGHVDRFQSIGEAAGQVAGRILAGESVSEIPTQLAEGELMVDWRALRRHELDPSRLPAGTAVLYREPSLWRQYRLQILGVLALLAFQTLLIAGLILRARKNRLERALRETEDRYRNVVEAQTDLVCRYLPDTTLTFVNGAYCRYFRRSRKELVGTKFIDLLPPEDRERVMGHVRALVANPRTEIYEHRVLRPDGGTGWQQWIDRVILDDGHRTVEIQGIGRDITRQKAAEQEVQQRREQVVHLTRVAILGELSGALAHELNQPLTAILTNAQAAALLLEREQIEVAELKDIVRDIVADDLRAGAVITRLRALFKRGATELRPLSFNVLVRESLELVHSQLVDLNVAVTERLTADLPPALGDRVQLQQVLLNLLLNACDALRSNELHDRRLTIGTRKQDDGALAMTVMDNGPGLEPGAAERLFEPFFTTKTEGLGLGLSICRSIVMAHHGQMAVRNNTARGLTVEFSVPVAPAGTMAPSTDLDGGAVGRAPPTASELQAALNGQ